MKNSTELKRNRKDRTVIVTPDRRNPYSPLAPESDEESIQADNTNKPNSATSSEAEEAYLPPITLYSSDSKSNTDDNMSTAAEDTSEKLTMKKLQELMEDLEPGCTTTRNKYTYTDISTFQITMGNALARIPAPYEQYGYSYLADTDTAYHIIFDRANSKPTLVRSFDGSEFRKLSHLVLNPTDSSVQ